MPNGITDFLFGSKPLKTAATGPTPAPAPATPTQSSGIDMVAEANKAAARAKSQGNGGPLASPMGSTAKTPPKGKQ